MPRTGRWVIALAFLSVLGATSRADEAADRTVLTRVDQLFQHLNTPESPGCAVGIVRDGKLLVARGHGMANLDDRVPITPQSVFELGSVTKSFTCVCVALLLDQGKLSPDDDVRKYVPELPACDPPITIRHLLRCRCGLPDFFHLTQLAGWNIDDAYTDQDVLALLRRQKTLPFKSGEKFSYTSSGYFLLGIVVQRVTGKSLARFARDNVFDPLNMKNTYYEDDPTAVVRHRVVGYNTKPGGGFRRWMMNSSTVGGWGLKSTVEDLFRWDQNLHRNKLPEGPFLKEFLATGTLLDNRNVLDVDPVERYRGLRRMQFTGGMPGFQAAMLRFPDQSFTVICLANVNTPTPPWDRARQIAEFFLADQMKERPKETDAEEKEPEAVQVPEAELKNKVGAYRMEHGRIWKITLRDGGLAVTDHLNGTYPLRALGPTRFRPTEGPGKGNTFVFERKQADAPFRLRLEWKDGKLEMEPVTLVQPTIDQLREYEGRFWGDELHATYEFAVRDGSLVLEVNNRRWERLEPTVQDGFRAAVGTGDDNRVFTFLRDKEGKVSGLMVGLWRVQGVRLVRQQSR